MRYIKIGKSYPLGESPDSHLTRLLPSSIPWFVQPALQYLLFTLRRFDDAAVAEAWLIFQRWPDGVFCPACGGDRIAQPIDRRPFPYRCHSCYLQFGIKTRSPLRCSKLSLTAWVQAIYLSSAVINPVGLDTRAILAITPRAARNLVWRIREAWDVAHETAPHDAQVEAPLNLIGRARTSQRGQVVLPPRIPTAPETLRDLSLLAPLGPLVVLRPRETVRGLRLGGKSDLAGGRKRVPEVSHRFHQSEGSGSTVAVEETDRRPVRSPTDIFRPAPSSSPTVNRKEEREKQSCSIPGKTTLNGSP